MINNLYVGNIFKLKKEIEKSEIEKKSYKNFFIRSEIILLFELSKSCTIKTSVFFTHVAIYWIIFTIFAF